MIMKVHVLESLLTVAIATTVWSPAVFGFVVPRVNNHAAGSITALSANVGIFFGTSTGSTEEVADLIKAEFGDDADGPFDIEALEGPVKSTFEKYDALIVGTPTWNTGSDTERSGTGWDEIYYSTMQELNIKGKKVAVFGLGDQVSYAENYADAAGELHDVFESLGCQMCGYTSMEGYEHEDSKSIRGDKFCGLLCDMVNQEELTPERVENWVAQLRAEGFFEGGSAQGASAATAAPVPVTVNETPDGLFETIQEHSDMLDETIKVHGSTGFIPHYNGKTKSTMWVSPDGRSCYYTTEARSSSSVSM
ncbi:flavodoxin [Nitzschia inconspicua]|uniref:Flavodoxin n=1 Tax=Nitzschia inconspicua TaxID=303405 RepID=A0A9K3KDB9_9STRA|nr:flavodoxin [Nitzschia inconspicua]